MSSHPMRQAVSDPSESPSNALPLILALVAGGGTTFGAVILLLLIPHPPPVNSLSAANASLFGRLQAASAGVMLALSFSLFAESVGDTGLGVGMLWAVGGFVVMLALEAAMSHHTHSNSSSHHHGDEENPEMNAGIQHEVVEMARSDMESLLPGTPVAKREQTNDPHQITGLERFLMTMFGAQVSSANTLSLVRSSFVTYMGLAIHNLPEGISVALTTASNLRLGVSLCLAILLHNVLEGMIVALPLWYTSRSKPRVLFLTLLNGLMEPLGVVIAWCLGGAEIISKPGRIHKMLCSVAGIMTAIAFGELMPSAIEWIEKGGVAGLGTTAGANTKSNRSRSEVYIRVAAWTIVGIFGGWLVMTSADFVLKSLEL